MFYVSYTESDDTSGNVKVGGDVDLAAAVLDDDPEDDDPVSGDEEEEEAEEEHAEKDVESGL